MKCIALAHHAPAHDWYISLATDADAQWFVHYALCMIDSFQQTNTAGSNVLFVKENFHQIIAASHISTCNKTTISIFVAGASPNRDDSEGGAESTPSHSIDEGDIAADQQGEGTTAR